MALNEFVQTALDEEGYEEGSDGYTKYGSWYGLANAKVLPKSRTFSFDP